MLTVKKKLIDIHVLNSVLRYFSVSNNLQKLRNIDKVIPRNALKDPQLGTLQKENGFVYDTKPFRLLLQKDKLYAWCLCGRSKSQPLCDNSHLIEELEIKLRPVYFKVEETKEYWLCNCKQTEHRPFCDGTHISLQENKKQSQPKE